MFNDEADYKEAVKKWYSRETFDEGKEAQVKFIEDNEQEKFFQNVDKVCA